MIKNDSVVAVYPTHTEAESAIKELQRLGYDMKNLSIVGKGYHTEDHVVGYYNAGDRMKYWGRNGAFWGGFWGLFFGSAFFYVPGIGPLLMAGPIVASMVAAVEGAIAIGGLSALGAGLYSLGIPENTILEYETAIKSNKFLVIAHGTNAELAKAKRVMHASDLLTTQ
jgi:hypothetical protein